LAAVAEGCSQLAELYIQSGNGVGSGSTVITDAAIIGFAEKSPPIQLISLFDLDMLTDASVLAIGQHCNQLRELYLHRLHNITGEASFESFSHLQSLYQIRIGSCDVNDNSLLRLAQACPALTVLVLEECPKLTDVGIFHLATYMTNLELFGLARLPGINTAECILEVCRRNNRLTLPGIKFHNLQESITVSDPSEIEFGIFEFKWRPLIHPDVKDALRIITTNRPPASTYIADIISKFAFNSVLHPSL